MFKGECSFLYMRWVFLFLFLLVSFIGTACPSFVDALEIKGELTGVLGTEGYNHAVRLSFTKHLPCLAVNWEIGGIRNESQWRIETPWKLEAAWKSKVQFIANHNREHHTTGDHFRLMNRNNIGENSYYYGIITDQFVLGYLRNIPLKNLDIVDALFCESYLYVGPLDIYGVQMKYAGTKERGQVQALQAALKWGNWQGLGGLGVLLDSAGKENHGIRLELSQVSKKWNGKVAWQRIEPGFISPLAKSNRFTPNRQGWQMELSADYPELKFDFNLRRHHSIDELKSYNQLSLSIESKKKYTSLEWRLEPTRALILRYRKGDILLQTDALRGTLRFDGKQGDVAYSFRLDGGRWIIRSEFRFLWGPEWRVIAKYDLLQKRTHYFMRMRHEQGKYHVQLEVGTYDQGTITAGFHNLPRFCIAWGWRF